MTPALKATERTIRAGAKRDKMKRDALSAVKVCEMMSSPTDASLFQIFFLTPLKGLAINYPRMSMSKL